MHFRCGINSIGVSSDGDPRLLSSMRSRVQFSLVELSEAELEICNAATQWIYTQDTMHIGTKIRNRLLKDKVVLPMGNKFVSISHLKTLLENVSKDVHRLVRSDICPKDRQNFSSLEKIIDKRVIEALENHVSDSQATVMFLRLTASITSSYLDEQITPTERIFRIWYAVYFLRAWRKFIKSKENNYRLCDNFISPNAYQCVEINAHAIVYAILKLRNGNKAHLFQPNLFSSQPCESTFRQMRALGTPNFTKINFSLYELLHSISRVELMYAIKNSNQAKIIFREKGNRSKVFELPNNIEIIKTIKMAKIKALEDAKKIGMNFRLADLALCELKNLKEDDNDTLASEDEMSNGSSEEDGDSSDDYSEHSSELDTDEDDTKDEEILEEDDNHVVSIPTNKATHSKHVQITTESGGIQEIRKSRLIWLLTKDRKKLSSDRLQRVRGNSSKRRRSE